MMTNAQRPTILIVCSLSCWSPCVVTYLWLELRPKKETGTETETKTKGIPAICVLQTLLFALVLAQGLLLRDTNGTRYVQSASIITTFTAVTLRYLIAVIHNGFMLASIEKSPLERPAYAAAGFSSVILSTVSAEIYVYAFEANRPTILLVGLGLLCATEGLLLLVPVVWNRSSHSLAYREGPKRTISRILALDSCDYDFNRILHQPFPLASHKKDMETDAQELSRRGYQQRYQNNQNEGWTALGTMASRGITS
ncbi:hypothetical protein CBER1_11240 [Cercospora berteroae]|uniref:Transmembrane protein n=1 Tax=Cercospora berteroae TaxID=357750 RepID=A0A2S6CGY9_9PEZI|nr:hypothetical protein CBER1_11240 [Cercospora berteroae]